MFLLFISILLIGRFPTLSAPVCEELVYQISLNYKCVESEPIEKSKSGLSFLLSHTKNKSKALMKLASDDNQDEMKISEKVMKILLKINHPNVVKLINLISLRNGDSLSLIENAGDTDLFTYVEQSKAMIYLRPQSVWEPFFEIVKGVKAIHDAGFIHSSLTLENIVYPATGGPLISNFDNALLGETDFEEFREKVYYVDPYLIELKNQQQPLKYTHSVDIHSLGVILYQMIFHSLPFIGSDKEDVLQNIQNGQLKLPSDIPIDIVYILFHLLINDPAKRPSLDEILIWIMYFKAHAHERTQKFHSTSTLNLKTDFTSLYYEFMGIVVIKSKGFMKLEDTQLLNNDSNFKKFLNNHKFDGKIEWNNIKIDDVVKGSDKSNNHNPLKGFENAQNKNAAEQPKKYEREKRICADVFGFCLFRDYDEEVLEKANTKRLVIV